MLSSTVDIHNTRKEEVVIDDDGVITSQNVNNKIFIISGKHLDVATNQNVTAFGNVKGMDKIDFFSASGGVMISDGKVAYRDSFLEIGIINNELMHMARFELEDEKKVKKDNYSFYEIVSQKKSKSKNAVVTKNDDLER